MSTPKGDALHVRLRAAADDLHAYGAQLQQDHLDRIVAVLREADDAIFRQSEGSAWQPIATAPLGRPYAEVWIVIQDMEVPGTRAGIRGVFPSQRSAEAEIAAIRAEHPDLDRSDFCVQVERIRQAAPSSEHTCDGGMNPPFPYPCAACESEKAMSDTSRETIPGWLNDRGSTKRVLDPPREATAPVCTCGSENQASARFGHSHLAWCAASPPREAAMTTYAMPPKFIYDVLGAIGEISVDEAWAAICRELAKMKAREHSAAYIHQTVPLTDGDRVVDTTPTGDTQPLRDMVCQLRNQLQETEQRVVTLEALCMRHQSSYRTLARLLEQRNATIDAFREQERSAVELLKDLRTFIEYARYELEPVLVSGAQFPSQACADERLAAIDAYFASRDGGMKDE